MTRNARIVITSATALVTLGCAQSQVPPQSMPRPITSVAAKPRTILFEVESIYAMASDGTNKTLISKTTALEGEAEWSPDGSRIVFSRYLKEDKNWEIFTMDSAGGHVRRLTNYPGQDREPTWSPDGRSIAFFSERGPGGIYLMSSAGTRIKLVTSQFRPSAPSWSPKGTKIAFIGAASRDNDEIFVIDRDGGRARRLTHTPGDEFAMRWSPVAPRIVTDYYPRGSDERALLHVLSTRTGAHRTVGPKVQQLGFNTAPIWSPDGKSIAFFRDTSDARLGIWRMSANGKGLRQLSHRGKPTDWRAR